MVLSAVAAILLGFLMYGISYLLTPKTSNQVPTPTPPTSMVDEIFGAILWICLAALLAFCIVGVALLINRMRNKKTEKQDEMGELFKLTS
jgi:TRAP-type C4-dicarboxylate transport system permease small subunit